MKERSMVPKATPTSYYGRPILKSPVWKPEVPWYFASGGLAGASAVVAEVASWRDDEGLARAARRAAAASAVVSPLLLVSDLGQPKRFLHMLRVFRPTSPLSMGSWTLAAFAPAAIVSWLSDETRRLPRIGRLAGLVAAALGPIMATYTGVLISDTAVPAWHEASDLLPIVFAASSAASAGAIATLATGGRDAAARRLAIGGTAAGLVATEAMHRTLGELDDVYRTGRAGGLSRTAKGLLAAGAGVLVARGRRRGGAVVGGALVAAGVVCERWAIFAAGKQSAEDPAQVLATQR